MTPSPPMVKLSSVRRRFPFWEASWAVCSPPNWVTALMVPGAGKSTFQVSPVGNVTPGGIVVTGSVYEPSALAVTPAMLLIWPVVGLKAMAVASSTARCRAEPSGTVPWTVHALAVPATALNVNVSGAVLPSESKPFSVVVTTGGVPLPLHAGGSPHGEGAGRLGAHHLAVGDDHRPRQGRWCRWSPGRLPANPGSARPSAWRDPPLASSVRLPARV